MRVIIITVLVMGSLTAITGCKKSTEPEQQFDGGLEHLYVSWDTMEFDKCVAVWLITRFIDPNAQFKFVPQGTQLTEGILYDVPGAEWSRKHRKCTSMCISESINLDDPAALRIVDIAGKIELNFWQLDQWPDAQEHFQKVTDITEQYPNGLDAFEKTNIYFDKLYEQFKDNH